MLALNYYSCVIDGAIVTEIRAAICLRSKGFQLKL
jgi:hypothetical protein